MPQEMIIFMLRSRHLAEVVSLATLFAIQTCFSLTAEDTWKKTIPTGYVLQSSTAKGEKEKKRQGHFQGHYD